MSIPQVKDYNGLPTLFVKDEPFFCLAGELHNSDTSDPAYMEREVCASRRRKASMISPP